MILQGKNVLALTEEEETLLNQIIDKNILVIKQNITSEGVKQEGLEDIFMDYTWNKLSQLFKSLVDKGVLIVHEKERALFCPKCKSPLISTVYICPYCQSSKVQHIELIEHLICGYTGILEKFISNSRLICPKCKTDLGPMDSEPSINGSKKRYKIIGSIYQCEICEKKFNKPKMLHICQKCGTEFDFKKGGYKILYNYEIPEKIIQTLKTSDKLRVLLVEDNPDDLEIILKYFENYEDMFETDYVSSGKDGLEKISNRYYDLILLDFHLPDINGLEILQEIKKREIDTPVIMLTGADDRETAVEAMKKGASDYIVKSLDSYKSLPKTVKQVIQNHKVD